MQEYLGFGPGAHSDFGGRRFAYARDLNAYIKGEEHLSESACPAEREREEERVMLALRTARGLDLSALKEDTRDAEAVLEECAHHGLSKKENGRWRLTPQGFWCQTPSSCGCSRRFPSKFCKKSGNFFRVFASLLMAGYLLYCVMFTNSRHFQQGGKS